MHLTILSIGRWKRGPERDLFERYVDRCTWRIELVELSLKKPVGDTLRRAAESRLVETRLDQATAGGLRPLVLLDERGDLVTSTWMAEQLGAWRDEGLGGAAFLVGGADGIDAPLRSRARVRWAFGRQTWPHLLVRVLLAEQLYRASALLAGHPYHRGD